MRFGGGRHGPMAGGRGAVAAHMHGGRSNLRIWGSHRANAWSTRNMLSMSVTLDVSKLNGQLNTYAFCARSKEGACHSGRDAGRTAGGRRVLAAAQAEGPTEGCMGARCKCGAHVEHAAHIRDAGRVEGQRLVECRRGLPSRKEGIQSGTRCGPRKAEEGVGREQRKRHAQGGLGTKETRGAWGATASQAVSRERA